MYEAIQKKIAEERQKFAEEASEFDQNLLVKNYPGIPHEAFYSLAGELVASIDPYTEADPIALLSQFLVFFGNCIGRSAHFYAEAIEHYTNEFVVLVGATSAGRKGSSFNQIRRIFAQIDPIWNGSRIQFGLSSGEGLIWAVRDPIEKLEPDYEGQGKEKKLIGYKKIVADPGVEDKRLLVFEAEFASTLRVLAREGNTLSAVIRNAWDTGELQTLTKNSQARSTGAHISIVGHITKDELLRYLTTTEAGNGFGNRFLWICVKRSKYIPIPKKVPEHIINPLILKIKEAIDFGRNVQEITLSGEATELWCEVYPGLSDGRAGLLGAITARAEAHTLRLATIYALLDTSFTIEISHLRAAIALWRYAEESAKFIFGDSLGDRLADAILKELKRAGKNGLTRTQISNVVGKNYDVNKINRALTHLVEHGLAVSKFEATNGRPKEIWYATGPETSNTKKTN